MMVVMMVEFWVMNYCNQEVEHLDLTVTRTCMYSCLQRPHSGFAAFARHARGIWLELGKPDVGPGGTHASMAGRTKYNESMEAILCDADQVI
jgi:hypothetical protein